MPYVKNKNIKKKSRMINEVLDNSNQYEIHVPFCFSNFQTESFHIKLRLPMLYVDIDIVED